MDETQVIQDEGNEGNANPDPVEGQQDASMPDADQQPTETDGEDGDLPEEVSDRTKEQFEKLKKTNQELADKLKKYERSEYGDSVFDYLNGRVQSPQEQQVQRPKATEYSNLNQRQVDNIVDQFISDDGTVNIAAMNKALGDANKMADQANKRATAAVQKLQQIEEKRQVAEAHQKYPWLNPQSDTFDPQGYELVRDRILRNMVTGKDQSVAEVAADVSKIYKPSVDLVAEQKKAVDDFKQSQAKKATAGAVSPNKGQPRQTASYSDLREKTLQGDTAALDERLSKVTGDLG
jgi:hypothetical protein